MNPTTLVEKSNKKVWAVSFLLISLGGCQSLGQSEEFETRIAQLESVVSMHEQTINHLAVAGEHYKAERQMLRAELDDLHKVAEQVKTLAERVEETEAMAMGSFSVHLASYRNVPTATAGWHDLLARYGEQLSGLKGILSVYSPQGGESQFYRLKAGPLPSEEVARQLCQTLEALGEYCAVDDFSGDVIE